MERDSVGRKSESLPQNIPSGKVEKRNIFLFGLHIKLVIIDRVDFIDVMKNNLIFQGLNKNDFDIFKFRKIIKINNHPELFRLCIIPMHYVAIQEK